MNIGAMIVVGGYFGLVAVWGWPGVLAALAHGLLLALTIPRK